MVDLSPETMSRLENHLHWLKAEALRRGWGEPEWLFPNEANRPLDISKAGKVFRRALRKAKLPAFAPYSLRHSFASQLLAAGVPITYVSAQLGHKNPATTLRFYAKWIPQAGKRFVDLLDQNPGRMAPEDGTRPKIKGLQTLQPLESKWSRRVDLNRRPTDYETSSPTRQIAKDRKTQHITRPINTSVSGCFRPFALRFDPKTIPKFRTPPVLNRPSSLRLSPRNHIHRRRQALQIPACPPLRLPRVLIGGDIIPVQHSFIRPSH